MKLFKWQNGRQAESGYKILFLLWSKTLMMDSGIIKYPTGSCIKPHYDKSETRRHYRLNIVLWKAKEGGEFICDKTIFTLFNRVHFFRPDLYEHSVTEVKRGTRLVFTIGKTLKKK